MTISILFLLLFHHCLQGFHSRPRVVPRALHITPSSTHCGLSSSSLLPSQTHYHSHTLPSHRQCNGSTGERVSSESSPAGAIVDSRRRLQPVGSDSQPKLPMEPTRLNGFKRSSLLLDSAGPVAGMTVLGSTRGTVYRSTSKGSVKSSSSSLDQQRELNSGPMEHKTISQELPPV